MILRKSFILFFLILLSILLVSCVPFEEWVVSRLVEPIKDSIIIEYGIDQSEINLQNEVKAIINKVNNEFRGEETITLIINWDLPDEFDTNKPGIYKFNYNLNLEPEEIRTIKIPDSISAGNIEVIVEKPYFLSLLINPKDSGVVIGEGRYENNEIIEIEAIPNDGYEFSHWEKNNNILSNDSIYQYTMPDRDATLTANFNKLELEQKYNLNLEVNPFQAAVLEGEGEYYAESEVLISIEEIKEDFYFFNWTDEFEGIVISNEKDFKYIMPLRDVTLTANFYEGHHIERVEELENITVSVGTEFSSITYLPKTVTVYLYNGNSKEMNVDWYKGNYNGNIAGEYTIEGSLTSISVEKTDNNNILNPRNLKAEIKIIVQKEILKIEYVEDLPIHTNVVGTSFASIISIIPNEVKVELSNDEQKYFDIQWIENDYNENEKGLSILKGELVIDSEETKAIKYINPNNLKANIELLLVDEIYTLKEPETNIASITIKENEKMISIHDVIVDKLYIKATNVTINVSSETIKLINNIIIDAPAVQNVNFLINGYEASIEDVASNITLKEIDVDNSDFEIKSTITYQEKSIEEGEEFTILFHIIDNFSMPVENIESEQFDITARKAGEDFHSIILGPLFYDFKEIGEGYYKITGKYLGEYNKNKIKFFIRFIDKWFTIDNVNLIPKLNFVESKTPIIKEITSNTVSVKFQLNRKSKAFAVVVKDDENLTISQIRAGLNSNDEPADAFTENLEIDPKEDVVLFFDNLSSKEEYYIFILIETYQSSPKRLIADSINFETN